MSPIRHRWTVFAASLALGTLLCGCSGSGSSEPTASHRTRHHRSQESSEPTEATTSPTQSSSPAVGFGPLSFSPKSGGQHLEDCQRLQPGDDPAEFLYYPVVITSSSSVTLHTVATDHTQGVVDAGAWIAPTGPTPETGTFKGWPPPKLVTSDSNLQWSKRVPAKGAKLEAGTSYNVFLRLQVDPTPGDSKVNGIQFQYEDDQDPSTLGYSIVWGAKTTFSMSC
jgi:hypothetical protein